ncbi:MAG: hypothetical protein QM658_03375 [Gordonia sp. (in: high G+C Gram-positive bacteria)]
MTIPDEPRKVLTLDAVHRSIEALHKPFIHEQFLAYLHIRKRGIEGGSMMNIEPDWSEVGRWLKVDGGPPNKPFYRPISSRTKHDPSGYWLNPNIPGSYAPSSLRRVSQFMLDLEGAFTLSPNHAEEALEAHLKGKPQPAWMFAGYFLRNYSFDPGASTVEDLIDAFCTVFRFGSDEVDPDDLFNPDSSGRGSDFDTLFTVGGEPDIVWFEPFVEPAEADLDEEDEGDE